VGGRKIAQTIPNASTSKASKSLSTKPLSSDLASVLFLLRAFHGHLEEASGKSWTYNPLLWEGGSHCEAAKQVTRLLHLLKHLLCTALSVSYGSSAR
jgi:hypothetical protein